MNKIYKVIWSKVKNQYVVVSELAHSNGKQSRTSRNSIRSRIAALVVCGAIAAFGVFNTLPTSSAFAEDVAKANEYQYVAIKATDDSDTKVYKDPSSEKTYNYHSEFINGERYWVRDGYTIEQIEGQRFPNAASDVQIQAIKSPNASTEGLLQSNRVLLSTPGQSTVLGNTLQKADVGVYMGATNEGGTLTPSSWNYYIQKNDGCYIDAGGANFGKYFVEAIKQADGTYQVNGKTVSSENLYVINDRIYLGTNEKGEALYKYKEDANNLKLGAFVVDGQVYTKNVFGKYNEVLMSAQQGNTYYSYWAADTYDADAPMQLTQGQYKDIVDTMWGNDTYLASSDISKIKLEKVSGENKKGGTISLIQQGDYNSETQSYENNKVLPGAITITSEGGTSGNDVAIKFSNEQNPDGFTVDAGSKVVGQVTENGLEQDADKSDGGKTLTGLKINGVDYALSQGKTYSNGNGISIDEENNKISVNAGDGLTFGTEQTNDKGKLKVNVGDGLSIKDGQVINNLKVTADTNATKNNKNGGNWTVTDTEQENVVFKNTTLNKTDSGMVEGSEVQSEDKNITYGQSYKVVDTDGNTVEISDVASANTLKNVDAKVNTNTTSITELQGSTIDGGSVENGVIKLTHKNDSGTKLIASIDGLEDYALDSQKVEVDENGDAVLKVKDRYNASKSYDVKLDGLVTESNIAAANNLEVKGEVTDKHKNGGNWTITDKQGEKPLTFTNTTLSTTLGESEITNGEIENDKKVVYGKDYTISDTDGNSVILQDVASAKKLSSVDNKIGELNYSEIDIEDNTIKNNDSVTTAISKLDSKVNTGWTVSDENTETDDFAVKPGETLKFNGDDNIDVEAKDYEVNVSLKDNIVLGEDKNQININGAPEGDEPALSIGDKFVVEQNGSVSIKADNTETYGIDTTVTVNPDGVKFEKYGNGTTVINGQTIQAGGVAINGEDNYKGTITGLTNTTLGDGSESSTFAKAGRAATEEQLQAAMTKIDEASYKGWNVSANGENSTTVESGKIVDFSGAKDTNGDSNITVTKTVDEKGNAELAFDLNDNITLGEEGDNQININGAPEDGEAALSIGDKFVVEQNGSVSIKADNTETYGTDTTVTVNPDGVKFEKYGNGTTVINGQTIQAGGVVINGEDNGVYKGTITGLTNTTLDDETFATVGRAATEEQLKQAAAASKTTLSDGVNTTVTSNDNTPDGHVDYQVNLNDNVYLGGNNKPGSSNIELDGENGTIQVGSNIILDSKEARAVIGGVDISTTFDDIGKKSSTITGLSNTTWDTDKVVIDRAATEGQLQMVSDKVTAGWTATDDAGNKINVNPETRPTLNFASGKNITVSANEDSGEVEVSLNDNINLNDRVYINGDPEEGNNTIVDIKSGNTSKEESIFAVEDKGNGSISIGGIDITNVDGPYLAVGDGKLKFYKDGGLATGNETGTLSVRPDGDLEISGKNSSFNVDAETGNVNAVNSSGSAIMMNDDSVALNASGNGVAISDEGILLNTNGIDEDIKLVTKGTSVSVDNDGATFTNTNTNETTNIDGGTINVGDRLMVEEDGSIYATNNNGSTVMINDNGVALNSEGNGVVVSGEGITLNTNGSAVTVDRFNGATFTNTNTGETTNINGDIITTDTVKGLSNTTWDDELATQVANSEELQGTAATQGQLQQAVSAVATEAAKQHTTVSGDDNLTVKSSVNENGGTNYQVTLDDDITLGNPKAGNTEGERSFTINTTNPEGYVPESYKTGSGADFIEENGGFMLFATDTQGHGIFGVTAKGSAWGKDFKTYTTDIYGNNTQYSLNEIGDAVAQMSSYYNGENGKSYTVFSRYLNEAEKDNPFVTVDEDGNEINATRDIPLALRDDGAVLIGATIKGDDFTDNGIRINAETDADGNNKATITGLENTEWKPPTPVATFAANDINTTSRAATESQLNDLYSAVAAYDVNVDGTIDYSHIALAGAPYGASRAGNGTPTGGTSITNVAYASGKDGSEAVNVDYLKDAISDAAENGSISTSDQHLVANTETGSNGVYKPNDDGNVNLIVSDEKGNSSTITIGDVASKEDLDNLKDDVGDLDYSKVEGDTIIDGDSVTTAIGKLDNKIENISGTATDADNNTVTGGKINSDGTISLTQKDKDSIKLEGQLTDSGVVQEGTSFDKETGTITITSQDKYSGETSSVKVEGIASTEVVGATNKEDLATAYKDADKDGNATTEYITDSESMVEADVALDHAIQDVANTSYANDMVLSNRIDSVEKRLGNVEERIDKVGAMAAAIANLRTMGFDPEAPTEIAIGVGQYKSETGIAIGVFHYPNQDFMLSASLSSSGDELMGGIGATWKLGRKSAAERAKDEEARHLEQAEEMKKLAQQEKVKAQAQRHAKLLAERQQASQKNA